MKGLHNRDVLVASILYLVRYGLLKDRIYRYTHWHEEHNKSTRSSRGGACKVQGIRPSFHRYDWSGPKGRYISNQITDWEWWLIKKLPAQKQVLWALQMQNLIIMGLKRVLVTWGIGECDGMLRNQGDEAAPPKSCQRRTLQYSQSAQYTEELQQQNDHSGESSI